MRVPAVQSPSLYERPGYRTLLGRIRSNVRGYIRKQLELPRQEIAEIVRANLRAAMWFGVALALVFGALIALVVFVIGILAIWLPLWASALIGLLRSDADLDAVIARLGGRVEKLKGKARKRLREQLRKEIAEVETGPRAKEAAWSAIGAALTAGLTLIARRFASRLVADDELPDE